MFCLEFAQSSQIFDSCFALWLCAPIGKAICRPGTPGRHELDRFVAGETLPNFRILMQYAAMFRFVRVAERWVESLHVTGTRLFKMSPNAGAAHLCFHSALRPLRQMLAANPKSIADLSAKCDSVRHIVSQLRSVGLWEHPSVSSLLTQISGERSLHRKHRSSLLKVLYHTDDATLQQALSTPPMPKPQHGQPSHFWHDGGGGDGGDDDDPPPPPPPPPPEDDHLGPEGGDGKGGGSAWAGSSGDHDLCGGGGAGGAPPGDGGSADKVCASPSKLSKLPSVFGGALHDAMWTKACLSSMRHLVGVWGKAGLGSHVFGVKFTFPNDSFKLTTLHDEIGAWCGPSSESDGDDFMFQEVDQVDSSHGDELRHLYEGVGSSRFKQRYLFFTLQDTLPSNSRLNPGSRSFSEWDSIVIAPLAVRDLTHSRPLDRWRVLVEQEQQGKGFGQASEEFQILTAASWPVSIMWSMSLWSMKDEDYYDFGIDCPAELRGPTQEVMRALLDGYRSRDEHGHHLRLPVSADTKQKLAALRWLLSIHTVELLAETDASTTWQLSAIGLKQLRISNELTSPQRAFDIGHPLVSDWGNAHVLVLHGLLAGRGWQCKVRSGGRQKDDESKTPYVKGGPLVFWISAKRATFSHPYFLLLLQVSSGILDCVVPHLSSEEQYKCLLSGKEYVRRAKGATKFHFGLSIEEAEAQEQEALQRKSRKRKPGTRTRTVGPQKKVCKVHLANVVSCTDRPYGYNMFQDKFWAVICVP